MRTSHNQTMTAFFVLMAGLSAIQATGFVFADGPLQTSVQVQPSSAAIDAGAFAKFQVNVIASSSAGVSLAARGVPAGSVAIFTPNVGEANPEFISSLTIVTSTDTPQAYYVVTIVAIVNGVEYTGKLSLQVLAPANAAVNTATTTLGSTLSMTINTDKSRYQPNSIANIQGQVTDAAGDAVADATITLQVDAPTGVQLLYTNSLQTDSAGTFQTQVALEPTAPTGTYTVFASASKLGYSSITTSTTFVVGTSTTPSVIIVAVYAGDSAGDPTSSFTSGQEIWIWATIQNIGAAFQAVVWVQVRDPNGVPVEIQTHVAQLQAGQIVKVGLEFMLPRNATIGVYTVNALVSDKLISQGGTFLASSETQFALTD